ncbi:MAG: S24 family peptidase [Alphaproteobacteria bacterium]|nr:S24 family peptidase [Alphaproteobacteria bacterium]MBU0794996.1 S24 family peptidase [Alphaproteobacteria bacterium]MBU0876472.1 S24 family peptidase [Alphaproteobacteria bacterium]MBU1769491.1 S24 family peptidase [Alphaproteobacteria bacterium]
MDSVEARANLDRLIHERGETYGAISRLLGRNPAYIQQFVKRGSPRKLDEADRQLLARYFGVDEALLGGPSVLPAAVRGRGMSSLQGLIAVPRLALGASAGPGSLQEDEAAAGALAFDTRWLRALGGQPEMLSIIRVDGESMAPTLSDGDDIMVDRADGIDRLRDGIYVLRMDDVLMVKRVALAPRRGHFSIRSDNPLYPTWEDVDPASVTIVGRVIWAGRRVG